MEKTLFVPKEQTITHHGDVVLSKVGTLPKRLKKIDARPLAFGETTGHRHVAVAERNNIIDFFEDENGNMYLQSKGAITVRHEVESGAWTQEHQTEVLPAGIWKVSIQRQRDPFTATIESVKD